MSELRWNPLLDTYTIVAANRQNRPDLPKDVCPFCPGSGNVPDRYEMLLYSNDFPALSKNPAPPFQPDNNVMQSKEAYGRCDVILYSDDHYKGLAQLPLSAIQKLIELWGKCYRELSADPKIKYIFPFENRGEEVGVTIHHPHGQQYAYPFVPLKVKTEMDNARIYLKSHGISLFSEMEREERKYGKRVVWENEDFIAYIPYFTDYPWGVFLVNRNNRSHIAKLTHNEVLNFAEALQMIIGGFDGLFNKPFPYMMCVYQSPVNTKDYNNCGAYYPLHIKFFPPLRGADKIKWLASSETGAWAAANTVDVDMAAAQLKEAIQLYRVAAYGDN